MEKKKLEAGDEALPQQRLSWEPIASKPPRTNAALTCIQQLLHHLEV